MSSLRTLFLRNPTKYPRKRLCCNKQDTFARKSSCAASTNSISAEGEPSDGWRQKGQYINLGEERKVVAQNNHHRYTQKISLSDTLQDDVDNIKGSLEETLEAHRKANLDRSKIVKVHSDVPAGQNTAQLLSTKKKRAKAAQDVRHLELVRHLPSSSQNQRKEYRGKSMPVLLLWRASPSLSFDLRFPWMRRLKDEGVSYQSALGNLGAEIEAASSYFSPTHAEQQATRIAITDIQKVVPDILGPSVTADIIGSRANGLADPLSDIDVNLVVSSTGPEDLFRHQFNTLALLGRRLRYLKIDDPLRSLFSVHYFAASARIPIIAATHHPTGLELQIQNSSNIYGSLEYAKSLVAEFPTIKPLFSILRQMLHIRGLCTFSQGGISSYPLLNMIATSLKIHASEADPENCAQHLLQFLNFFSEINFYDKAIAYRPSNFLRTEASASNKELSNTDSESIARDPVGAVPVIFNARSNLGDLYVGRDSFMMTLLDPVNPSNDLGRAAHSIKHVQATFLDMREQLNRAIRQWDENKQMSTDASAESRPLLAPLLEADYSLYALERKRLRSARPKREAIDWP